MALKENYRELLCLTRSFVLLRVTDLTAQRPS